MRLFVWYLVWPNWSLHCDTKAWKPPKIGTTWQLLKQWKLFAHLLQLRCTIDLVFILPKFMLNKIMNKSLIFNASKIVNYLIKHDIKYFELSANVFKKRLKKHLLFTQSISVKGDENWLTCNHDLFSDIVFTCTWYFWT